jgi:hypothetical protein
MLCQRTFSSVFRAVFLHSSTAEFNLECMWPLTVLECKCTGFDFVWAVFGSKKGRSNSTLQEIVMSHIHDSVPLHLLLGL